MMRGFKVCTLTPMKLTLDRSVVILDGGGVNKHIRLRIKEIPGLSETSSQYESKI